MHTGIRNIVVTAALAASMTALAAPITRQQALDAATSALAQRGITLNVEARRASMGLNGIGACDAAPYYIFNGTNAFVIAAGDDRMPAVLGYSDNTSLDGDNLPPGLMGMLEQYKAEVAALGDEPYPVSRIAYKSIKPLLKTQWGQDKPFNLMCPGIDENDTPAATDSVATAMAQVMFYYKWPLEMQSDIPAYVSTDLNQEMLALPAEQFPWWNNYAEYYPSNCDESSIEALTVAMLMKFCGQAVNTNYGKESGAKITGILQALPEFFQYHPGLRYLQRPCYSADEWTQLIFSELLSRRPVIYRGQRYGDSGHTFVIDGVDSKGLFHINWGWHGSGDGYFLLSGLNPMERDTDADPASDGYTNSPAMIVGIKPIDETAVTNPGQLSFYNLSLKETTFTRTDADAAFEGVTVTGRFNNGSSYVDVYDFGFALFNSSNQIVKVISSQSLNSLLPAYGTTREWPVAIDATIPAGTYALRPVSRVHGTTKWNECIGARSNYVTATITDQTLTLTPQGNSGEAAYTVTAVDYTGTMQAHRTVEMTTTLNNTGSRTLSYIYLLLDGACITAVPCEVRPSATGNITLHFAPQEAGEHTVVLALDSKGTQEIYHDTVTVTDAPAMSLTASATIKDQLPGYMISSGTFAFTADITNNGNTAYSDDVVARLYRNAGEEQRSLYATLTKHVEIAPGESTAIELEFPNLVSNESFGLILNYYSEGRLVAALTTPFYTMAGDFEECDINCDRSVDVTDLNLLINAVLGRPNTIDTMGREDVNHDGSVDVTDINLVINRMLKKDEITI